MYGALCYPINVLLDGSLSETSNEFGSSPWLFSCHTKTVLRQKGYVVKNCVLLYRGNCVFYMVHRGMYFPERVRLFDRARH